MQFPPFLDIPASEPDEADVLLLPLPFEATVSYGGGTAAAPEAIWRASAQVELWDEETDVDLAGLRIHGAEPLVPRRNELVQEYLDRAWTAAAELHRHAGLVIGVGGEHSVSPPLVLAAMGAEETGTEDLSGLTVVQFDAHADLRLEYDGTPHSHACAMRPLLDRGARIITVGCRSAEREEYAHGLASGRARTFMARNLARNPGEEAALLECLDGLEGSVYLTVDVDVLEVHLCPGTGTPEPGGLGWWQTLGWLDRLLRGNRRCRLIGVDVVETAVQPGTRVNEFVAARLLAKILAYHACPTTNTT
jgi:agmatinase